MHADVVKTMSNQLMDKQRTIDEGHGIRELHAKLEGDRVDDESVERFGEEKELREQRLKEENAQVIERSRRANAEFTNKLTNLRAEKEAQEKQLTEELRQTQAESQKKADCLAMKIGKDEKLQELAGEGVGGGSSLSTLPGGASPREGRGRRAAEGSCYTGKKASNRRRRSKACRGEAPTSLRMSSRARRRQRMSERVCAL